MDRTTFTLDATATRLRRVGRLARRRMRIEGDLLRNGLHTDGTITVQISGLGSPVAGVPDAFEWEADRPVALVIVRSGIDGEDVAFQVGPSRHGIGRGAAIGDGTGIRSVAFCYDAAPAPTAPAAAAEPAAVPVAATVAAVAPAGAIAVPGMDQGWLSRPFAPTGRERRSILAFILGGTAARRSPTSA